MTRLGKIGKYITFNFAVYFTFNHFNFTLFINAVISLLAQMYDARWRWFQFIQNHDNYKS